MDTNIVDLIQKTMSEIDFLVDGQDKLVVDYDMQIKIIKLRQLKEYLRLSLLKFENL